MCIKTADLNFDFTMTFNCPHCGKENDCEPEENHSTDTIFWSLLVGLKMKKMRIK